MKLLLIYPAIECSTTSTSTYSVPLGMGSIGTYCGDRISDLEVRILDGSIMSHEEQVAEVSSNRYDVVGINPTIASQRNAYEIARLAKKNGAVVVFGGVHSSATWGDGKKGMWRNMLTNKDFIDGVVLYDGEIPMHHILTKLSENHPLMGIPNLAFRDSGGNIHEPTSIHIPELSELPDIDYSLFDLQRFFEQTQRRGFGKAVTYYAGKGCAKRGSVRLRRDYSFSEYQELVSLMDVCTFCGRNELGLRNFEADREAKIVRELHEKHGVTGFFNVQDTVNLRNTSPIGLNDCWFRLFIGVESLTSRNIQRLKQRYGNHLIFQAGIEAANPSMRRIYGKKETNLDDLESKVRLMREEGIQLHASFILGGRGETRDSMLRTTDVAQKLAEYTNVTWILVSPQLVLPGSPDHRALLQMPGMAEKYENHDLIDIAGIHEDFLRWFVPELTRKEIVSEIKRTFNEIRKQREDLVLDVKGVVEEEEEFIKPNRSYVV